MRKITISLLLSLIIWQTGISQDIIKSSVMIANSGDQWTRNNYSVTNIAWGFLNLNDVYGTMNTHDNEVVGILGEGRKYHARVEFDAGWKPFIDYCAQNGITYTNHSCLTVAGDPFEYPWFAGNVHKNKKPYWMSSNSPTFIAFMKWQIDMALQSGASILMIDAQTSSALACKADWVSGDFSTHSLDGFKAWLQANYSSGELTAMGVSNVSTFNYRTELNSRGIQTDGNYKNGVTLHEAGTTEMFLYDLFKEFQNDALNDMTKELIDYAHTVTPGIMAGVSSPLFDPYRTSIIPEVDFYQQELPHVMEPWTYEPELTYKLAESLGKPMVLTAEPRDWEEALNGHIDDEEIKGWIAAGYANGANFIAPAKQWAYGNNSYTPGTDMTYIFDWIQNNKSLFDNRTALKSNVALIHARESVRKFNYDINKAFYALEDNNMPFDLLIAGDEFYESTPTFSELNSYEKVIVCETVYNSYIVNNPTLLANLQQLGGKLELFGANDNASDLVPVKNGLSSTISMSINSTNVDNKMTAFPRIDNSASSQVVHLINTDYNTSTDSYNVKSNVVVKLDGGVFPNSFSEAKLHRPGQSVQTLTLSTVGNDVTVSGLGDIDLWGIIELVEGTPPSGTVNVASVSVSPSTSTINAGGSVQLTETVLPANASDKTVSWSSSNTGVATVSNAGLVQAVSAGSTTITVTTIDGSFTATTAMTINAAGASLTIEAENFVATGGTAQNDDNSYGFMTYSGGGVTGINWNQAGDWGDYDVTISEAGDYQIDLVIGSPNNDIAAEISVDGTVIFNEALANTGDWGTFVSTTLGTNLTLSAGTHTIRVKGSGSNAWQYNMDYITLTKVGSSPSVSVTSVSLDQGTMALSVGNNGTLTETVNPGNATDKSVNWSTSNAGVATVSNGLVSAVSAGSAVITVTTVDGSYTATSNITVTASTVYVTSVSLDQSTMALTVGNNGTLTETVNPGNATDKSVSWSTSNGSVATVSNAGVVSAIGTGSATITVTTNDGSYTDSSTVTITSSGGGSTTLTIELENFISTGGTALNSDNSTGFMTYTGAGITGINYNQGGDWGEYTINVTTPGLYEAKLSFASPNTGIAVEVSVDGTSILDDALTNTGDWGVFQDATLSTDLTLTSGSHTIKVEGSGTNAWQWNGDNIILTKVGDLPGGSVNVTSVSVTPSTSTLTVGGSFQLGETVLPSNATDKTVSWSSSNTGVATVSNAGFVQAVSAGSATITVTTTDGSYTATTAMTINAAASASLTIEAEDYTATGGTTQNDNST
ncbi:MAG: Ig-like domain-containing protein, partial [Reichenbachiella sp.]